MHWLTALQFQQGLGCSWFVSVLADVAVNVTHSSGSHAGVQADLLHMAVGSQESEGGHFQASSVLESRI